MNDAQVVGIMAAILRAPGRTPDDCVRIAIEMLKKATRLVEAA